MVVAVLSAVLKSDHTTRIESYALVCVYVCMCVSAHISGRASTCPWLAGIVDVTRVKQSVAAKHST